MFGDSEVPMSPERFPSGSPAGQLVPSAFVCSCSNWGKDAGWVHLAGELDLAASPRLARTLEEALQRARLVVLDLRELTFMDSAGLHIIVEANIRARRDGRRLLLVRGGAQVRRLFVLAGAGDDVEILDLYDAEEPAYLDQEAEIERDGR